MAVYLLIIGATTAASHFAVKLERRSRVSAVLLYCLVVLVFCYFAGARSLDVGTDTSHYISVYYGARFSDFASFMTTSVYSTRFELLSKLLMWFSARVLGSSFWFYFAFELFTVLPVLIACRKVLGSYVPFGMFVFATVFYPMSFNISRQLIAMGFVLLQYCCINEGKGVRSVAALLVAVGFHHTAALGLALYPLCMYGEFRRMSTALKVALLLAAMGFLLAFAREIFTLLTSMTGLYGFYTSWGATVSGGGLRQVLEVWALLAAIGALGAAALRDEGRMADVDRLFILIVLGAAGFSLCLISFWFYRIGLYFLYFGVLLVPLVASRVSEKRTRLLFVMASFAALAAFAFDYYVVTLANEVVPYEFALQYV